MPNGFIGLTTTESDEVNLHLVFATIYAMEVVKPDVGSDSQPWTIIKAAGDMFNVRETPETVFILMEEEASMQFGAAEEAQGFDDDRCDECGVEMAGAGSIVSLWHEDSCSLHESQA